MISVLMFVWVIGALFTFGTIELRKEDLPTRIFVFLLCVFLWPFSLGCALRVVLTDD